jgi:AsmA family protein
MRWKWILAIIGGIVVAAFIIIVIFAATYDFNKFKPQIAGMVREHTGRDLKLAGDITLGISLFPTLKLHDVTFQNAAWGSRPEMLTVKLIAIQFELLPLIGGNLFVEGLRLIEPDYLFEVDQNGTTNMHFDVAEKPDSPATRKEREQAALPFWGLKDIAIENGKFTFYDHRSNRKHNLTIDEYTRKAATFGSDSEIKLVGSYNENPIQVLGKVGPLQNIFDPVATWSFDLSARAFEVDMTVAGHIQDVFNAKGIDVKLSAGGKDLQRLENAAGEPLPVRGPFKISGHIVAPGPEKIDVSDVEITLGQSEIRGSIGVDRSSEIPRINAKLTSESLDLRPVIAQEKKRTGAADEPRSKTGKKSKKVFPSTPFEFESFQRVNADIDLQTKQLLLPHLALNNFSTRVGLNDGRLTVNPLVAGIGGGRLGINLDLSTKGSRARAALKVNVKQLNLNDMLTKLQITNSPEGMLDLDIDLNGQGNSLATIMAGLNGDVVAVIGEGKFPTTYPRLIAADLGTTLMKLFNPLGEKIESARINCAVCDFSIKDGMAASQIIMLDDPQKTITSEGNINLKTEGLDFRIQTKPKEGFGTQKTGTISVSLSEITKPFKLGGTLAEPSLQIDAAGTAMTMGRLLLGPVGIASLFVSTSSGKSPCVEALRIANQGTSETREKSGKGKDQTGGKEAKKEGLGNQILNIFKK